MRHLRGAADRRAALPLLMLVAGCRTWQPVPPPPAGTPTRPTRVRVLRTDGSRLEVVRAYVRGDTLYGKRRDGLAPGGRAVAAVPVDSIRRLEALRVSGARTGALAGGLLLGVVAAMYAVVYYVGIWSA